MGLAHISSGHASPEYRVLGRHDNQNFATNIRRYRHLENFGYASVDIQSTERPATGTHNVGEVEIYLEEKVEEGQNQAVAKTRLESVRTRSSRIEGSTRIHIIVDICTITTAPIPAQTDLNTQVCIIATWNCRYVHCGDILVAVSATM
jgi:hypothetical protein